MTRDLKKYAESYRRLPFEKRMIEIRRKVVLEQMRLHKPRSLLEVGCGLFPLFLDLPRDTETTICEPTTNFYETAVRLCKGPIENCNILNVTLEKFAHSVSNPDFDFIVISSLLHEVSNIGEFMDSLRRLCQLKTVVHINVPNALSLHRIVAYRGGLIASLDEISDTQKLMQQNRTFSMKSLSNLMDRNNFQIISSGTYFLKPFTHHQMELLLASEPNADKIIEGLEEAIVDFPDNGSEVYVNVKRR